MINRMTLLILVSVLLISPMCSADVIWSEETDSRFEITVYGHECEILDGEPFWKTWDGSEVIREPVIDNCFLPNAYPPTCCPSTRECVMDPTEENYGECAGQPSPFSCSDYDAERYDGDIDEAERHCRAFDLGVARTSVEVQSVGIAGYCSGQYSERYLNDAGETCEWIIANCSCQWNEEDSVCESKFDKLEVGCIEDDIIVIGECTFTTTQKEGDCETDDFVTYTWDATWSGTNATRPLECAPGSQRFSCEAMTKLPFFTFTNLLIAILLIVVVYFFLVRKKRK
jgi:hypothetical protein